MMPFYKWYRWYKMRIWLCEGNWLKCPSCDKLRLVEHEFGE